MQDNTLVDCDGGIQWSVSVGKFLDSKSLSSSSADTVILHAGMYVI